MIPQPFWANPHGNKLCRCDNRGKKAQDRCRCHRAYRDPLALWGWDSYRECWVYGHSMYELTAYSFKHACQLPLLVSMADCSRHDSVHGLVALYRGRETLGLPIQTASLDAAHDALGLFRLATQRWHTALIIPLNQRNKDNLQYAGPLRLVDGVPICPAELPIRHNGFCPDRLRIKWRCPLAASKRTPELSSCPHFGRDCSDSAYGRVIYTYPQENYRLHTLIPRDSDLWNCHQDQRSCAERSVKRKKLDFGLLQTRTAGRERWLRRELSRTVLPSNLGCYVSSHRRLAYSRRPPSQLSSAGRVNNSSHQVSPSGLTLRLFPPALLRFNSFCFSLTLPLSSP